MAKKLKLRDHMRGSGVGLTEDPARKARWDFMTESLADDAKGYTRTDRSSLREKRIMMENLFDTALRCVGAQEEGPVVLDRTAIEPMYEYAVRGDEYELDESTTMGWTSPGVVPSTAKIFTTQSLGMVRRIFPRMIATDLISVQPLSQPTGKVFYLDVKYDTAGAGGVAVGDRVDDPTAWTSAGQRDFASYTNTNGTNVSSAMVEGSTSRQIKLDMSSVDVQTETKKLSSEYPVEVQQDFRAYHGLDADAELVVAAGQEITREIDRTLIDFISTTARDSGAGTTYWNKNGYAGSLPSEQKAWDETLWDAIEDAAADIEGARYRRPTWILANHDVCSRIRKLNGFRSMMDGAAGTDLQIMTGGRRLFGTLQNTFYIYSDPWFDADTLILGYKGEQFWEAGIVYGPYVPLYRTPLFTNPLTMMNQRGVMSRFAKVSVVPQMYARVIIVGS